MSERSAADFIEMPKSYLFSRAEAEARKLWARRFVTEITGVARGLGYGMFHGGSLIRDIDLVAVPWRGPTAMLHLDFVFGLVHSLNLQNGRSRGISSKCDSHRSPANTAGSTTKSRLRGFGRPMAPRSASSKRRSR